MNVSKTNDGVEVNSKICDGNKPFIRFLNSRPADVSQ